jgi:hypothetical protein
MIEFQIQNPLLTLANTSPLLLDFGCAKYIILIRVSDGISII